MRTLTLIIIVLFSFSACKKQVKEPSVQEIIDAGDHAEVKEKLVALQKELAELTGNIDKLDKAEKELDTSIKKLPLVTAFITQDTLFKHYVEVQGTVETKQDVMVYPEYSGVMTRLYVREGQYVSRGALVAKVDDGGLTQQIAQQQVQLNLAKTTFQKQKSLWDQNIGSEIQYLQAKSNVEALEQAIAAMRVQMKKVNVYAPFGGVVEEIITEQGQVVSPGATPLFRLVNLGSMYVKAEVPEAYLSKIKRGTEVEVEFTSLEKEYTSKVRRVNNTINPNSRSFIVEVSVPNRDKLIKPNLIAKLRLNDYTNKEAILIPDNIIQENAAGERFVFVSDSLYNENETIVRQATIESGEQTDGLLEILSGLEVGERIILEGSKNVQDGQEVRIID